MASILKESSCRKRSMASILKESGCRRRSMASILKESSCRKRSMASILRRAAVGDDRWHRSLRRAAVGDDRWHRSLRRAAPAVRETLSPLRGTLSHFERRSRLRDGSASVDENVMLNAGTRSTFLPPEAADEPGRWRPSPHDRRVRVSPSVWRTPGRTAGPWRPCGAAAVHSEAILSARSGKRTTRVAPPSRRRPPRYFDRAHDGARLLPFEDELVGRAHLDVQLPLGRKLDGRRGRLLAGHLRVRVEAGHLAPDRRDQKNEMVTMSRSIIGIMLISESRALRPPYAAVDAYTTHVASSAHAKERRTSE